MSGRVMTVSSAIALLGSLLWWSIVWIVHGGELELVHVTHKLEGLSGFLLLVGSSTVLGVSAAALLTGMLPGLIGTWEWRRLIVWAISGAVLGEMLVVLLGLAFVLVGRFLSDHWRIWDAFLISFLVWALFAAPFGAANAALLWKANLRAETAEYRKPGA